MQVYMFDAVTRAGLWTTPQLGIPLSYADVSYCDQIRPSLGTIRPSILFEFCVNFDMILFLQAE